MDFYKELSKLPKAELHVHLDGSLREDTILSLSQPGNPFLPYSSVGELRQGLCFQKGWDLRRCLESFQATLSRFTDFS
ncbi:hypothetical protein J4421_03485 [Candidatus Woesearchaeota archaeon]|nr:hypothetical protein [Candidatus Woesearchaeota archaeon]